MGCASNISPRTVYVTEPAPFPDYLLHHPCKYSEVGEDVGSLYFANEMNIICIQKYSAVMDTLIIHNQNLGEVSGGNTE